MKQLFPDEDEPTVSACTNLILTLQNELHRQEENTKNQTSLVGSMQRKPVCPCCQSGSVPVKLRAIVPCVRLMAQWRWMLSRKLIPFTNLGSDFGITTKSTFPLWRIGVTLSVRVLLRLVKRAVSHTYGNSAPPARSICPWCGWMRWGMVRSKELRFLPLPVFNLIAQLLDEAIATSQIPKQFLQARMVCVPMQSR